MVLFWNDYQVDAVSIDCDGDDFKNIIWRWWGEWKNLKWGNMLIEICWGWCCLQEHESPESAGEFLHDTENKASETEQQSKDTCCSC